MSFTLEDIEAMGKPIEDSPNKSVTDEVSDVNNELINEDGIVEVEVQIERELFYSEDSNYGIYGASPTDYDAPVKLNKYGNISIKGVMQQLVVGTNYTMRLKEVSDNKYGTSYEVQHINVQTPTTIEQQKEYLKTILTSFQVANIYAVYEGYDVIQLMKDDKFDYDRVYGMGEYTYEKVRDKVLRSLELIEVLAELAPYGMNYNMVNRLVKHFGDNPKLTVQKIKENPYSILLVDGISFKTADAFALNKGIEPDSEYRINACLEFILNQVADRDGHCWLKMVQLYNKTNELLGIGSVKVKQFLESYIDKPQYIYHIEEKSVGLQKNFMYELMLSEKIKQLLKVESEIKIENVEERINEAEKEMGENFKFTDEQREGIRLVCNNNVSIIRGKAGTGKTTILKGAIKVIGNNLVYTCCALSGKAANRMEESTGFPASTIHRALSPTSSGFAHNANLHLPSNVIIVDESSMINLFIFYSLIMAVRNGAKLIIIGDTEQLEPIGAGNVFKDLCESNLVPTVTLTQVHRQAQMSGILSIANEIRDGICSFTKKGNTKNKRLGELKDLFFNPYEDTESVVNRILDAASQYKERIIDQGLGDIHEFQVIVARKAKCELSCENLNIQLQQIFNPDLKPSIKRGIYEYKEGDKIIQCGNNYDDNVFNGTLGTILEVNVEEKEITIDFFGISEPVIYKKEDIGQIDLAYALTVHRVQGSQFKHLVIGIDFSAYTMLTRQLVYTALTRAMESCILAVVNDALIKAIATNKSDKRNTYLPSLLEKSA